MIKIIKRGVDKYRATCSECATIFSYQREDVRTNYFKGVEEVFCPHCLHAHRHCGVAPQSYCYEGII